MKSFVDFSENLEDKKQKSNQIEQKIHIKQQIQIHQQILELLELQTQIHQVDQTQMDLQEYYKKDLTVWVKSLVR